MQTGFLATLPQDVLLSAGVLFYTRNALTTRIGVTEGAPDFDPGIEHGEIMFDNHPSSRLKGLARRVGFTPVVKGTIKEFGPLASGGQLANIEPGVSEATASGTTTETVKAAGALFAAGEYVVDFRWIFERGSGGFAAIRFPLAICRKWTMKGVDKKEAQIAFEFEAIGDPANSVTGAPYTIELLTSLPFAVDEVTFLRNQISGGDSAMLALYSTRAGLSQSSGQVTQWDDARGTVGFGPSLLPDVGGNGLSVNGTDPGTLYLRSDSGKRLYSPASSLFDLSAVKAICMIGTTGFSPSTDAYSIAISKDVGDITNFLGIDQTNLVREGLIGVITLPTATRTESTRAKSAKIRLTIVARDASHQYVQVPPINAFSASVSAAGSGTARLLIGFAASNTIDEKYRAVLLLNRVPTTADIAALTAWARTYHPAVNAGPRMVTFEGDSITVGQGATSAYSGWVSKTMERSFYAAYDDVNCAVASSVISGGGVAALNITDTSRYTVVDGLRDATRTKDLLVVWIGTNDIWSLGKTGAQAATDLFSYLDARVAAGRPKSSIAIVTMLPRDATGGAYSQTNLNTQRAAFNSALRANWSSHCGALFDVAADPAFSPDGNFSTGDFADGTHPSDAGNLKIANIIDPLLQAM